MTFDNRFMVWAVLNDIKFLNLTNFIMTPKKDVMIENDLIKSFKFLNLDINDFKKFIKNKKANWRYVNYDLSTFFPSSLSIGYSKFCLSQKFFCRLLESALIPMTTTFLDLKFWSSSRNP